ncbi:MAG: rubrerythrin family protein [Spirochaetes bacterium]|nr:MAG: rubrerythrin family protein [Spirochaetota bacterium]
MDIKGQGRADSALIKKNQRDEITGYEIYSRLAARVADAKNAKLLADIATSEKEHYAILKKYSGVDVKPARFKVFMYLLFARVLGLTFTLKLQERAENGAGDSYAGLAGFVPEIATILADEDRHEHELIDLIKESRLEYMGSIVLGLNDALVELTGALAGYTFALQDGRLIAVIGLITGIAASLSMASSEFLSKRQEGSIREAMKASLFTGGAYVFTVIALITPFLTMDNPYHALAVAITVALVIIFLFNYYISVAKDLHFGKRFAEMASISLGVAALSFGIGWLVRSVWGIEV